MKVENNTLHITNPYDLDHLLTKISLKKLISATQKRIAYGLAEFELDIVAEFVEERISALTDRELKYSTIKKLKDLFFDGLKQIEESVYYEFFIRKKDVLHFHRNMTNFFGADILDCIMRTNNPIKCEFVRGYNKFDERFSLIKDAIQVRVYYSCMSDLVELGEQLKEKDIETYSFDEMQSLEWQIEALKEENSLK